jgi:hydroxyacylglutathione hydrolase
MIVETLGVGQLQTNCYIILDEGSRQAAVIDPGGDADQIVRALDELEARLGSELVVRYVFNTHAHFDHVLGNGPLLDRLGERQSEGVELVVHPQAVPLLSAGGGAHWFGFRSVPSPDPDRLVEDGDVLQLGESTLEVLNTPGHSQGSISLYCASAKVLFVGDVLFRQGVGRADLPGGDWPQLMRSIRDRVFALPDDTMVYPGHGPATTVGREKHENPFVRL